MMRAGLVLGVVLVLAACGSTNQSTAPGPTAPIIFPAGNGQTDTINAVLAQALVVRVSAPSPISPAGSIVQFVAISDSAANTYEALIAPLSSSTPSTFVAESLSDIGQASVVVVLGTHAGRARIVVKVPGFGYVDTATFTIAPGHAVGIHASPVDTAAYANGTVKLNSTAVDRAGNSRPDGVIYSVLSGPASVSGSTVTVTGIGRIAVAGSVNGAQDTTYISGVPTGHVAASFDNLSGIAVFNLDGSAYSVLTSTAAGTVKWAPSGTSLVFDQTQCAGTCGGSEFLQVWNGSKLVTVDTNAGAFDAWPAYSRDGMWIYYSKGYTLWRAHPDGSVDSLVPTPPSDPVGFPSASPDGSQVAYVQGGGGHLKVLTLSNGTAADLGVTAESAVWSPTGNVIAYNSGSSIQGPGGLAVINSDGSGQRAMPMSAGDSYGMQFDWSPDGQWLITRDARTAKLVVINVASGLLLPLGYTGGVGSPTWH